MTRLQRKIQKIQEIKDQINRLIEGQWNINTWSNVVSLTQHLDHLIHSTILARGQEADMFFIKYRVFKTGSIFVRITIKEGINGFYVAARIVGLDKAVEQTPFGTKVLNYPWPPRAGLLSLSNGVTFHGFVSSLKSAIADAAAWHIWFKNIGKN